MFGTVLRAHPVHAVVSPPKAMKLIGIQLSTFEESANLIAQKQ